MSEFEKNLQEKIIKLTEMKISAKEFKIRLQKIFDDAEPYFVVDKNFQEKKQKNQHKK